MLPKKMCFISTTAITMHCFLLPVAAELTKENIQVTLICSEDPVFAEHCRLLGLRYLPVHMARGIDRSGLTAIRTFRKIFKQEQFDLVQYCTPNAAFYASLAAKLAKVPIRLYCQWGIRYVGFSGLKRHLFKWIERIVCRISTDIRAVSQKNKAFAVAERLYSHEKAIVLGNGGTIGVDFSKYNLSRKAECRGELRKAYHIPDSDVVFGFCGRLSRDKGSNEILSAFRELTKETNCAILFLVGDVEADTGIQDDLLCWAKASDRVIITGKIAENEVYRYYAPMDVLVHPTYREGFGMVLQEAGAMGVPAITTDIPGASEVMEDKVSCLLIPAKDSASLQKAMRTLLDDPALRERIGQAAYTRTQALYDRSVMLGRQKKDYLSLLERRSCHEDHSVG